MRPRIPYRSPRLLPALLAVLIFGGLPWGAPSDAAAQADTARIGEADYRWPTNASQRLSSTFGETRRTHFHAAVDIKTWGRQGYDVYAARDGTLHRLGIGPRGYGKVIYLKHGDGSYSVYAHLLAFEESIQQLADSLRMPDYAFELDRVLDSLDISVERGEKIGVSGATGIGPPHLHFELRTPENRPFNPLLTNLSVEDNIAPAFSGLAVEPLSPSARVEGAHRVFRRNARETAPPENERGWVLPGEEGGPDSGNPPGRWFDMGTVRAGGEVGLAVDVFDQADEVYNAYAAYELKMWVDGELRFHSRVDSFSYEETGQMFLDRIYPLLQSTGRAYQRLWIADGNTLPFYRGGGRGRLSLEPGRHRVVMEAADYFGNRSRARLTLEVGEPGSAGAPENISSAGSASPDPRYRLLQAGAWDWRADWVFIPHKALGGLSLAVEGDSGIHPHPGGIAVDLRRHPRLFAGRPGGGALSMRRIVPGKTALVSAGAPPARSLEKAEPADPEEGIFARFPAGTFHDTVSVGLEVHRFTGDSVRIGVHPAAVPVAGEYELWLPREGKKDPRRGVYHYDPRRDRLDLLPLRRRGDYLVASADKTGTHYLLADRQAPELHAPEVVRRADGRWVVTLQVREGRSGLDHTKSRMEVNGVRGIAEYEPEDNRLVYYRPGFQPPDGRMVLSVYVTDRAGNATEREFLLGDAAR